MSGCDNDLCLQQEDEKKNKKKQPPVDERPTVPVPSDAMLNSKCFLENYYTFGSDRPVFLL